MGNINLGNFATVTLTADMQTPAQFVGLDKLRLTVPDVVGPLPPPGEFSTLSGQGVTVHGYLKPDPNGGWLFMMTAAADPSLAKVDTIPGPGGWADTAARDGYLSQGNYLLGQGITGPVLWPGLTNFYSWTKADLLAKGWKAPA